MKKTLLLAIGLIFTIHLHLNSGARLKQRKVLLNNITLTVEIADTRTTRMRGLMYRRFLKKNEGMLFVYKKQRIMFFWMKNTYINLDIGFFDKNKILKTIKTMKKFDETPVSSEVPVTYALETNSGWFKKNKIKIGQSFSFIN